MRIFILLLIFRLFLAFLTWHPDLDNHVDWGIRFWQYGPGEFYRANVWNLHWPNQPPGTILLFASSRKLYEAVFSFFWWLNVNIELFPSNLIFFLEERLYPVFLKLPSILADLGIAYLIFRKVGLWAAGLFLINPVIWYNSSLWGQTDSVIVFWGLLAFFLLLDRRLILALLAFSISLFIKATLIILLPVFLVVAWRQKYRLSEWAKGFLVAFGVVGLITLPFSGGEPFSWLFTLYKERVFGLQLNIITANAFNLWSALFGIHARPDTLFFGPFTFRVWGYIGAIAALIPLLIIVYKRQEETTVLKIAGLTIFASFLLLTGMHERYLYPLFPILTVLAAREKKFLSLLVVLSGIHLLNLYNFWWYPTIGPVLSLLSAGDRLLPRLLGLATSMLFVRTYRSTV